MCFSQLLTKIIAKKSRFQIFHEFQTTLETMKIFEIFQAIKVNLYRQLATYQKYFDRIFVDTINENLEKQSCENTRDSHT